MKWLVTSLLSLGLLSGVCFSAERPPLSDLKAKESYSLGYQFGQSLKVQGVDLDLEVYTSGIQDALSGSNPQLGADEIRRTVAELQIRLAAARQKATQEAAAKNIAAAKVFLDENKAKDRVVTLPSGLQYKVLVEGSGRTPKASDAVTVNYRGTLIDGTEFDSSFKRGKPATLQVSSVIRGWSEALQLMKEGSKWQLFLPPHLAYGERSAGPIPPGSALVFDVELVSVN